MTANFSTSEVVEERLVAPFSFAKSARWHTAKDAVSSVVLLMHPLNVVLDMDATQFARTRSTVDG